MDTQKYSHFIILWTLVFVIFDLYFSAKLAKYLKRKSVGRVWIKLVWTIPAVILVLYFIRIWFRYNSIVPDLFISVLLALPIFWYAPKLILVPFFIAYDLFKYLNANYFIPLFNRDLEKRAKVMASVKSRRDFISAVGWTMSAAPFLGVADGLFRVNNSLYVKHISVPINHIPFELKELKIVHISDFHVGSFTSTRIFENMVWMIRAINPDLIFITGDFVNFTSAELKMILPQLQSLTATYGTFGCLGNHDHYMNDEDHKKLISIIESVGVKLLINENVSLKIREKVLQIAGIDNISYRMNYGDIEKAMAGLDPAKTTILLSHDPMCWDKYIIGKHKVDLTLSGHNHGGQLGLQFGEKIVSPLDAIIKRTHGLYHYKDQYLYVNAGIGSFNPPVRIGIKPEITFISFTEAESLA